MTASAGDYLYAPFFCEENVWHLARHPDFSSRPRLVVFVSNERRQCPLWGQRAAEKDGPVVWDYHVILVVKTLAAGDASRQSEAEVVDLDCVAGPRLRLDRWLEVSFPRALPRPLQPRFRLVDGDHFVDHFVSDRRHMRTPDGWNATPPPWPPIGSGGSNLFEFLDVSTSGPGCLASLADFVLRVEDLLLCDISNTP